MIFDPALLQFPYRLPPDFSLHDLLTWPSYTLAFHYMNLILLLLATSLLWGSAVLAWRMHACQLSPITAPKSVHASLFAFIAIGVGLGIMMAGVFVLIVARSLTSDGLLTAFVITSTAAIALLFRYRHALQATITFDYHPGRQLTHVLLLFVLLVYQISSADSWMLGDSTSYHVPYADFFLKNAGISAIPEHLIYPYHALNIDLLYSIGLLLDRDLSFLQAIHAMFAALTLWGTYLLCRHVCRNPLPALIALFLLSQTYIIHFTRFSACVDLGSLYIMLCCYTALLLWMETRARWLLEASAIAFGMALGVKYLMFVFALPIALALWFTANRRDSWQAIQVYALWTTVFGAWWYVRNAILAGNPVHPFATSIFGLYLWDANDVIGQAAAITTERIPRTLAGFALMPWYAAKDAVLTQQGADIFIDLLFALTLFSPWLAKRFNLLLLACWIYTTSWFFGTQDPRHLEPVMPLLLVYVAALFERLSRRIEHKRLWLTGTALPSAVLAILLCVFVEQQFMRVFSSTIRDPILNEEAMRRLPSYDLMARANEIFKPDETIYEFYMRDARWFFKGNLVGNQFGPHGYAHIMAAASDQNGRLAPEKLEKILRHRYNASGFMIPNDPEFDTEKLNNYFDLKYRNNMGSIYRFRNVP